MRCTQPFALRFLLATDAEALTQVLGIAYRMISAHVLKKARLTRTSGATGAVTLIQRFGSALNLNIHLLVLDGAYLVGTEPPVFRRVGPPGEAGLQALVERLAERVERARAPRRCWRGIPRAAFSSSTPRPRTDRRSARPFHYVPGGRGPACRAEGVFVTDDADAGGGAEERRGAVRRVFAARRHRRGG